jgi:hypothetical protein
MENTPDIVDKAITNLWRKNTFSKDGRDFNIILLLRKKDWRPINASWWKKKEACIIGADTDGNFYIRVCDGTVRFWDHKKQADEIIAKSTKEFFSFLV